MSPPLSSILHCCSQAIHCVTYHTCFPTHTCIATYTCIAMYSCIPTYTCNTSQLGPVAWPMGEAGVLGNASGCMWAKPKGLCMMQRLLVWCVISNVADWGRLLVFTAWRFAGSQSWWPIEQGGSARNAEQSKAIWVQCEEQHREGSIHQQCILPTCKRQLTHSMA